VLGPVRLLAHDSDAFLGKSVKLAAVPGDTHTALDEVGWLTPRQSTSSCTSADLGGLRRREPHRCGPAPQKLDRRFESGHIASRAPLHARTHASET